MHRAVAAQCCDMSLLDPVPERMVGRPFRLSDAVNSGLSMAELSGPLWRAPSHGVRMWDGLAADDPVVRIRVVAATLPSDAVITGWAAAYLLGVQWLDGRDLTTSDDALLDVVVLRNRDRPPLRRRGLRTLRSAVDVEESSWRTVVCYHGAYRVRAAAFIALVEQWRPLKQCSLPGSLLDELADYVRQRPRWRGVPHARRVLGLVVPGAESPMESRLRLIWIRGGLPRPLVNVPLYDRDTGYVLGRPDLLDDEAGVAVEYDGAHHRGPTRSCRQRARTQARAGRAALIRFDNQDALRISRTLAVMQEARQRGLRRDRRHEVVAFELPWWFDVNGP